MANNTTVNISIPIFTSPTSVISVNNWIVFQQNINSLVSFDRGWTDYKNGFGDPTGNFWMGLEKLHILTNNDQSVQLRIELLTTTGTWVSVEYTTFIIDSESGLYRIHVSGWTGDTPDIFTIPPSGNVNNGMAFSTKDRDNDLYSGNCVTHNIGRNGFWPNACGAAFLNGNYGSSNFGSFVGGAYVNLQAARMMIKLA